MKNNYLLPACFKKIGLYASIPFGLLSIMLLIDSNYVPAIICKQFAIATDFYKSEWFTLVNADIVVTFTIIGLALSLLFIAFAREKVEDEYISHIREKSLVWAVLINYGVLCLATLFLFEFAFMTFAFVNLYVLLILFIGKFNYELYQFKKSVRDEE